ncbi:Pentalenolactone synthase [Streptomyces cyanogenus]|uniref:Lcm10 n=2 Tax=Streptomyces cyanogenus TaxID=80860 RepID=A0A896WDA1_STRCY|nr:Lcm10 [Streptomyces cyanogenus]QTE02445.1 Pentalenolactone synthase [Streptomyces cyanogenus]
MTMAENNIPSMASLTAPLLGINEELRAMQEERPIWKVRTYTGDEAWLVMGASEIKRLLVDRRLGRSHPDPANAPKYAPSPVFEQIMAEFERHAEIRALLTPYFSRTSMRAMQPKVEATVAELVETMLAGDPPAELQKMLARPLAMRVLCELVGIPVADQELVGRLLHRMAGLGAGDGDATLGAYLTGIAAQRRAEPREDMISGLVAAGQTDERVATLVAMLLFAGGESVATHIGFGVARLATDDALREALSHDHALIEPVVEEMLRTASHGGGAQPHYANADIEIAGVTIRAGDLVLPDFALANFDARAFENPEVVDLTRSPNQHLAFAHGSWHCLGAPLARMELRTVYTILFERAPSIRLAVPLDELNRETDRLFSTMPELSITW